jgi:hypothetical protein
MWHPTGFRLLALSAVLAALLSAAWLAREIAAAPLSGTPPATATRCSSFGTIWARAYDRVASSEGNPVRILSACCRPSTRPGVHWCFLTVTLAGTKDRGCEYVPIGPKGTPVGPGKHETCPKPA